MPSVNPYGLIVSLAVLLSFSLTAFRAKKRGLKTGPVWDVLPWVVFFGLAGARLYHVFNFWSFYLENPFMIAAVWRGGLGIYGGLIGGLFGAFLYLNLKSQMSNVNLYLDAAAPAISLGQAVGRLGNVFNGENLPYAEWEIAADLIIFFLLVVLERAQSDGSSFSVAGGSLSGWQTDVSGGKSSRPGSPGTLFPLYLILYASARFVLEFFRSDSPWIVGPLTVAQWMSLAVITVILLATRLRNRHLRG